MIKKLQKRSLSLVRIIAYCSTLFIGLTLTLLLIQISKDSNSFLDDSGILNKDIAVVSKKVSIMKTLNKDKIYFSESEKKEIESQPFVEKIHEFYSANFRIMMEFDGGVDAPLFKTDLFFESIPTEFLEVDTKDFIWDSTSNYVPIIVPRDYVNLYNFGFAESQGLPVISEATIQLAKFNLEISGANKKKTMKCGIAGFSSEINSILVPSEFLHWANSIYSNEDKINSSRLLVEFKDIGDSGVASYFEQNNLSINEKEIKRARTLFFFKSALGFSILISIIVVLLSIQMMLLGVYLILQRNKTQIQNLYLLGYSQNEIGNYYQKILLLFTFGSIAIAWLVATLVRNYLIEKFEHVILNEIASSSIYMYAIGIGCLLLISIWFLIRRKISSVLLN